MKIILYCWNCNKEYDSTNWDANIKPVECPNCGGFIITPSGKVKMKIEDMDVK
jgi:DNA-directed RNA polymerase subunit RPC12/RpoP